MASTTRTAGLTVSVESAVTSVSAILAEAIDREPPPVDPTPAEIRIQVQHTRVPFGTTGWSPLTRGAWTSDGRVIIEDACSSGLDLLVEPRDHGIDVSARHRPSPKTRALALAAPSRHHLLTRAVLLQYPALWWAGTTGRVPLHVSALLVHGSGTVLAGPGGTGKSTLLRSELAAGGTALSDNLCVGDAQVLHAVTEPLRITGGTGRRMPHGRREAAWPRRADGLAADQVIVVRRGSQTSPVVTAIPAATAARALTAGTYAAGELRRYWAFAATLALGTGLGPAHPPIAQVATELADRVPCLELLLPAQPGTRLRDLDLTGVTA